MDENRLLRLSGDPLAEEACKVLNAGFECVAELTPRGKHHDIVIRFPAPFLRSVGEEEVAHLSSNKTILVEVKSHQGQAIKLRDLWQLHCAVLGETRRLVPIEEQDKSLIELQEAASTLEEDLRDFSKVLRSRDSFGHSFEKLSETGRALRQVVELAVYNFSFLVKGVLLINPFVGEPIRQQGDPVKGELLDYCRAYRLTVVSWPILLDWHRRIQLGLTDPLDFWCSVFDAEGYFGGHTYDWRSKSRFIHGLFQRVDGVLSLDSGPRFLKFEEPSQLGQ